ncbi:MAG: A/G-specific adenine glycosylase [Simkaniaceae bacterium]|nr:A/G-specific adenine glycosylase [Simkaniaceae bacterium]
MAHIPVVCDRVHLKRWFAVHRRPFPWRENRSPYAVWVSEVMLQQTRANVVVPYFTRWMKTFPTIRSLAEASSEEVLKAWEGLGYYSRARRLHEGAKYVLHAFRGNLPEDPLLLQKIKGLGPYTIGAIRSFAFRKRALAVDGNILRLFSRLFAIEGAITERETRRRIESRVEAFLPESGAWIVMEGLIELGALVCKKRAECVLCPLKKSCLAFRLGKVESFPFPKKRTGVTLLHRLVCVLFHGEYILLRKGKQGRVMADLWEFPYVESEGRAPDIETWRKRVEGEFSLRLSYERSLPVTVHTFTRYKAHLYPHLWKVKGGFDGTLPSVKPDCEWITEREAMNKPFSSGHLRIFRHILGTRLALTESPGESIRR